MSENEHLFPWGIIFWNSKYIIIIEEEKAEETEENWEGKMKLLRNYMENAASAQSKLIKKAFEDFAV